MRTFRRALALGHLLAALAFHPASAEPGAGSDEAAGSSLYVVKLFNIDDTATLYVNGRMVGTCPYNKTCSIKLARYLHPGKNKLRIEYRNRASGYAWGYRLTRGGKALAGGQCGKVRVRSCGPGQPSGIFKVISKDIVIP